MACSGRLGAFSADATSELDVLGHDGDTLGVDGAQVGVCGNTKYREGNSSRSLCFIFRFLN